MQRRAKAIALAGAASAILVLGLALPAGATGGSLRPGNSMCTDQTRSSSGVSLSGTVTTPSAAVTWTLRAASSAGGNEAQVFQKIGYTLAGTSVAAPRAGDVFYRLCLANTTNAPVSAASMSVSPRTAGSGQVGFGPTTAVLGTEATLCGELTKAAGHLTASASSPVTFFVRAYNGDLSVLRSIRPLTVTTTRVDQQVGPGAYAFLDVCAINHSATTASVSMQFA